MSISIYLSTFFRLPIKCERPRSQRAGSPIWIYFKFFLLTKPVAVLRAGRNVESRQTGRFNKLRRQTHHVEVIILILLIERHVHLVLTPAKLARVGALNIHGKGVASLTAEAPEDHEPERYPQITKITNDVLAGNAVSSVFNGNFDVFCNTFGHAVTFQFLLDFFRIRLHINLPPAISQLVLRQFLIDSILTYINNISHRIVLLCIVIIVI